ncbi:hypothetical protein ACHWQZ_G002310 [Mnemiopsis leidyi]
MMVIDYFSKKLWAIKTKRKTGLIITNALKDLLTSQRPTKIQYDDGTEFLNRHFQGLLQTLRIKGYSVSSERKASIVERVIETIKTRMFRQFTMRWSKIWYDILPDLVASYNSSYHSSIKRAPNEVNKENENEDHNSTPLKGCYYESELQVCDKSSGIFLIERIVRRRRHQGQTQYLVKYKG